jgi:hypothetical protein
MLRSVLSMLYVPVCLFCTEMKHLGFRNPLSSIKLPIAPARPCICPLPTCRCKSNSPNMTPLYSSAYLWPPSQLLRSIAAFLHFPPDGHYLLPKRKQFPFQPKATKSNQLVQPTRPLHQKKQAYMHAPPIRARTPGTSPLARKSNKGTPL